MSDLNLSMVLRLVDQATGPARAAIANVQGAAAAVSRAGANTVAWADKSIAAVNASRAAMRSNALEVAAAGAALALMTKPAIDMEQSMAGVRKVIDFNDQTVFGALQNDILGLISSKGIPMTAEGIAAIIESAGQAGIINAQMADDPKRRALIAYAEAAAKMGVAFDVSAETAGGAMTMWRSRLQMTHDDAMVMGDAVNHLSNNMDASAAAILNVINRQGAVAQSSGLVREEITALSAAFVASAPSPEIAATGMKNFLSVMTKGGAVTDAQAAILDSISIDPEALAKRMQVDAKGGILAVMDALAQLPQHTQAAALSKLFGEESKAAITPMLTNLDMLRNSFELVAAPTAFAGSMLKEYESQAGTTAANVMKLRGFMTALSVTIGSSVLPEVNALLGAMYPVLDATRAWAAANPHLVSTGLKVAAGLVALKAATIGLKWAYLTTQLPVLYVVRGLGMMMNIAPRVAMGLLSMINPMNAVRFAAIAMRSALLFSGAGAIIAGIAMGGAWIYNNWAGLKTFFTGFGEGFIAALGPAAPMINKVIDAGQRLWGWVLKITGPLDASADMWRRWGIHAGDAIGGVVAWISTWTGANPGLIAGVAALTVGLVALRSILLLPARLVFGTFRAVGTGARAALLPVRLLTRGVAAFARGFGALVGLRPLNWARFIPRIPWAQLAGGLKIASLIFPFAWSGRFVGKIPWVSLAGKLALSSLIKPLVWNAKTLPNFKPALATFSEFRNAASKQMNGLSKDVATSTTAMNKSIANLRWRMAELAVGAFMLMNSMPEPKELPKDGPERDLALQKLRVETQQKVVAAEAGMKNLPVIGQAMKAYEWTYKKVHGTAPPQAGGAVSHAALSPAQSSAVAVLQSAKPNRLPYEEVRELAAYKEELLSETRALESKLANLGDGAGDKAFEANYKAQLAQLQSELASVETDLKAATTEAVALKNAVGEFSDAPVTVDLDYSQVTSALTAATNLAAKMREIRNAGAAPATPEAAVQARALGGAFNPGWLLTGERGPELRYTSQSGFIAHNHFLRSAVSMSETARRNIGFARSAASSITSRMPKIDMRPAMRQSGLSAIGPTTINATFNITAAPGSDPRQIANDVMAHLKKLRRRGGGGDALHDGGDYDVA